MTEEELSLIDLGTTTVAVAKLWRGLSYGQRSGVKTMSHDLYDALCQLLDFVEEEENRQRRQGLADTVPVVAPVPLTEPESLGYPLEEQVADLKRAMELRRVRGETLHHARKLWVLDYGDQADVHAVAHKVTTLAQAFEHYLTDGTVHEVPVNPNRSDDA